METKKLYQNWAGTYDFEIKENGYITPYRCAKALKKYAIDMNEPLIDIGCGTGLSGEAFKKEGFANIDGTDFSTNMIEYAKKKNVYKNIYLDDANNSANLKFDYYQYIAAVGVISPSHAGYGTINKLFSIIKQGGLMVFSLNDHALKDQRYENEINKLIQNEDAILVECDYGEHLPNIELKSKVFVINKIK